MSDSYIKSYRTCQEAYNGFTPDSTCIDYAAQQAQQNFENYLKNFTKGSGDLQTLQDSYGQSQTITCSYLEIHDAGGRDIFVTKYMDFSDNNSHLDLPPNWDTYLGSYQDSDPTSDTPHTSNNFTAQFFNSLEKLAGNSVLEQLSGGLSDDDYHSTLGNLTSPADQEKLCAVREKIRPLVTFFTALQKSAQAVRSNPSACQNVSLDLPGQSLALSSSEFAKMLVDRINDLNNLAT